MVDQVQRSCAIEFYHDGLSDGCVVYTRKDLSSDWHVGFSMCYSTLNDDPEWKEDTGTWDTVVEAQKRIPTEFLFDKDELP